jgi:hypothetical protein
MSPVAHILQQCLRQHQGGMHQDGFFSNGEAYAMSQQIEATVPLDSHEDPGECLRVKQVASQIKTYEFLNTMLVNKISCFLPVGYFEAPESYTLPLNKKNEHRLNNSIAKYLK